MGRSGTEARSERGLVSEGASSFVAARFRRHRGNMVMVALAAVVGMVLTGCSSLPDASGHWEGSTEELEGEALDFEFDLNQDDDGDLGGRARMLFPESEPVSTSIDGGQVREDGSLEVRIQRQSAFQNLEMVWDGQLDGDQMSGNLILQGENLAFTAERIAAEEAERRDQERERSRQEAEREEQAAEREQQEIADRVGEVDSLDAQIEESLNQIDDERYAAGDRLAFLEHADGELLAALGDPQAPEQAEDPGSYYATSPPDCEWETLCGQAEGREQKLAEDRDALETYAAEEAAGERHSCHQAINYSYWQPPEDIISGVVEDYEETRSRIQEAREGLPNRFDEALSIARERQQVASDLPENERPEVSYSVAELENLRDRARAAKESSAGALEQAEVRRGEYETRVTQVTEEASVLYERAGCDD